MPDTLSLPLISRSPTVYAPSQSLGATTLALPLIPRRPIVRRTKVR